MLRLNSYRTSMEGNALHLAVQHNYSSEEEDNYRSPNNNAEDSLDKSGAVITAPSIYWTHSFLTLPTQALLFIITFLGSKGSIPILVGIRKALIISLSRLVLLLIMPSFDTASLIILIMTPPLLVTPSRAYLPLLVNSNRL
jgi:hypothetical protein